MKRTNQYQYYELAEALKPLASYAEGQKVQVVAWTLHMAKVWLRWLMAGNLGHSPVVSYESARTLLESIKKIVPDSAGGSSLFGDIADDRTMTWSEAYSLRNGLQEFETIFSAEVATLASYLVSKKGIYDTADLIERAENAVDEMARKEIGAAATTDFQQAGKCLAFELPTAAGYHTMRATEAVVRIYWALVRPHSGTVTKPPDMAVCINELRADGEDPKLMDALDHIKDLHRNTLMHPEAFLTMKDALRLFDIAKSAISHMGDRIRELRAIAAEKAKKAAEALAASIQREIEAAALAKAASAIVESTSAPVADIEVVSAPYNGAKAEEEAKII
jgi:hypothetical protein